MNRRRETTADPQSPPGAWSAGPGGRLVSVKRVLCVLPRKIRANPLKPLLKGYELSVAASRTGAVRACKQGVHDLFVVYAPLGWADAADVCRAVRECDPHTPLIVYSTAHSKAERREVTATGASYVGRADDAHNLAGTAGQLIMLAELRSMEALVVGSRALEDELVSQLAKSKGSATVQSPASPRLRHHARRLFANAGGSRANFERMWPALYEAALRRLRNESRSK